MAVPDIVLLLPSAAAYCFVGSAFVRTPWFAVSIHALFWFGIFIWSYYSTSNLLYSAGAIEACAWIGTGVGVAFYTATHIPELISPSSRERAQPWKPFGDAWPLLIPGLFLIVISGAVLTAGIALRYSSASPLTDSSENWMIGIGAIALAISIFLWIIAHWRGQEIPLYTRMVAYFFALILAVTPPALVYEQSTINNWFNVNASSSPQLTALFYAALFGAGGYVFVFILSFIDSRVGVWRFGYAVGDGIARIESEAATKADRGIAVRFVTFAFMYIIQMSFYLGAGFAFDDDASISNVLYWVAIVGAISGGILLIAWLILLCALSGDTLGDAAGDALKEKRSVLLPSYASALDDTSPLLVTPEYAVEKPSYNVIVAPQKTTTRRRDLKFAP